MEWNSLVSQIPTDHQLVSVRFAPPDLPRIGKGRWSWPLSLLSDTALINRVVDLGIQTQTKIEHAPPRTEEHNPQTTWQSFKIDINRIAKDVAKSHLHKIHQRIRTLTKDLRKLANANDIDASENARLNEIILEKEIQHLQKKTLQKATLKARVQWAMHGETISKYWSRVNKQRSPRDVIYRLKIPNTNRHTSKSEEMAKIAMTYHNDLQSIDTLLHTDHEKREARRRSLNEIPISQKLNTPPERMNETLKEEHVLEALLSSKSGSAAGMDGIPYDYIKNTKKRVRMTNQVLTSLKQ